jgi:hypothetical protein
MERAPQRGLVCQIGRIRDQCCDGGMPVLNDFARLFQENVDQFDFVFR